MREPRPLVSRGGTARFAQADLDLANTTTQEHNPEYDLLKEGEPVEHVKQAARYMASSRHRRTL